MATALQLANGLPAPTRTLLQTIDQRLSHLDEQISEVARTIGLPHAWDAIEGDARSPYTHKLVRARAEWALRWILQKLKSAEDTGSQTRANAKAWKLTGWMIQALPASRSALRLREFDFLSILEKTLEETSADSVLHVEPNTNNRLSSHVSESSETVQEDLPPSRKRKRDSAASSPSKQGRNGASAYSQLFDTVQVIVQTIRNKAGSQEASEDMVQAEHMKIILRTETSQAARILKYWLTAVQRFMEVSLLENLATLDLSSVIDIWEFRATKGKDDLEVSIEQFSAECLIPTLILSQSLQEAEKAHFDVQNIAAPLQRGIQALDRLLIRYVLTPSRIAFLKQEDTEKSQTTGSNIVRAELLSRSLETLRAKILEGVQIEDAGEPIPLHFNQLFASVPHLLALLIRSSPARTPKARTMERPWMEAAFIALAQCVGCSLQRPDFTTPKISTIVLEKCLRVLASLDVVIDTATLKDLFWYHSGIEYPLKGKRTTHWSLIAAIIELDTGVFLPDPRMEQNDLVDRPPDLSKYLFDHISGTRFKDGHSSMGGYLQIAQLSDEHVSATDQQSGTNFSTEDVTQRIIIPVMAGFASSRNLLGFLSRWDDQLRQGAQGTRHAQKECRLSIWENHGLLLVLSRLLEQSLTAGQISNLIHEHAYRLKSVPESGEALKGEAFSSAVIVQSMLQSDISDETVDAITPYLQSLWYSYSELVRCGLDSSAGLATAWVTLRQLLGLLWPAHLHGSLTSLKELLYPLIERASEHAVSAQKEEAHRHSHSHSRATAIGFLFAASECLWTLPGTDDFISTHLSKALEALAPGQLEVKELSMIMQALCVGYARLFESLDPTAGEASFTSILLTISSLDEEIARRMTRALSRSIFLHSSASIQAAYIAALLAAITQEKHHLNSGIVDSLQQVTPSSISREQREACLNRIGAMLLSPTLDKSALLSIMVRFMEVPNATADISSDGNAIFEFAQGLHNARAESPLTLQLLQTLAQLTLTHIIPNRDQTQNKEFLEKFSHKLASTFRKPRKCFPARLAILRGTFLASYAEDAILSAVEYVELLTALADSGSVSDDYILEAFNEIPLQVLQSRSEILTLVQHALQKWVASDVSIDDEARPLLTTSFMSRPERMWPTLHNAVARYRLYPHLTGLLDLSTRLLSEALPPTNKVSLLSSLKEVLSPLGLSEKLALVSYCISRPSVEDTASAYRVLAAVLSTMENRQEVTQDLKEQQLALLPSLCSLVGDSSNHAVFNAITDSINTILREKPSFVNQHSIECVLAVVLKLSSRNSPCLSSSSAPAIFERLCETTRLILLLHRGRLGGRFHLLVPVLQSLLLCLFVPNVGSGAALPPWLIPSSLSQELKLDPINASQYGRLLSALCSPTQSSVQRPHHFSRSQTSKSKKALNDPVKAAREFVSQFAYALLSSFCRYHLHGRLDPHVREKLMPGVWEMIEVGNLDRASLDSMFAGLGGSERDVWKGIWEEWQRVNGRSDVRAETF